jgi:antitoxin component YwqK of YwqJK toxin-antitoxin module
MNLRILTISYLIAISIIASGQIGTEINKTDQQGRKQGRWIKKYPNENVMYDGFFKDDHPVGEFRRYYENNTIKYLLIFN